MGFIGLFLFIVASIVLFFLLNYFIDSKIYHFVIVSVIYVLLVSGLFSYYQIVSNYDMFFFIVVFEFLIRVIYMNLIKSSSLFYQKDIIKKYIFSFLVVFSCNSFFISKVNSVFLDMDQLKLLIWLLVCGYVIYLFQNGNCIFLKKSYEKVEDKYDVIMKYVKLKREFSSYVHISPSFLKDLIYAMMIYEDRNHPFWLRKMDYYLYRFFHKKKKFGIMQVSCDYYVDDINSIDIAVRRVHKIYLGLHKKDNIEKSILREYYHNNDTSRKVLSILKKIKKFNKE